MRDGLGQHRLPASGRPIHQHAPGRVDADLLIEVKVGQRQLDGLFHLLLLRVHAADVAVRHVGLLIGPQHGDGGVGLGREDVDEGVGVFVQRDRRRRLQQLAVQRAQDADVVIRSGGGAHDARVLVDGLEELSDDEGDALDALDFLLGVEKLLFEVSLLVFDVFLLNLEEFELLLEPFVARVKIVEVGIISVRLLMALISLNHD